MEQIGEFLLENWVIILALNILAILFIVGYLVEKHDNKKNKTTADKIIWEKVSPNDTKIDSDSIIENGQKILKIENDNRSPLSGSNDFNKNKEVDSIHQQIDNNENIITSMSETNYQTLKNLDEKTREELKNNIENIINRSENIFSEFDRVIPNKKIIDDELRDKFTIDESDVMDIHHHKSQPEIDINIDLPEIDFPMNDGDIWD